VRDPAFVAPRRVEGIRLPPSRIDALHLLMTGTSILRTRAAESYAVVELRYRDGTHARLPIVYRTQIWEWYAEFGEVVGTRIAYVGMGAVDSSPQERATPRVYAVRLENPYPQRELTSLSIESAERDWAGTILLAVTLEPAPAAIDPAAAATAPH
jgi:hypothetical protein